MSAGECDECGEPEYFEGVGKCQEHARKQAFAGHPYVFYSTGTRVWASKKAEALREEGLMVIEVHDAYSGGAELWIRKKGQSDEED